MDLALIALIVSTVGLVLQIGVLTIAAVWAVGAIKGTTERLGLSIDHLSECLDRHQEWMEKIDSKTDCHAQRITRVETQLESES